MGFSITIADFLYINLLKTIDGRMDGWQAHKSNSASQLQIKAYIHDKKFDSGMDGRHTRVIWHHSSRCFLH